MLLHTYSTLYSANERNELLLLLLLLLQPCIRMRMAFSSASDIWNVQLCVSTFLIIHEIVSDLTVWTTGWLSCRKDEAITSIMCGSTSGSLVLYSTGITAFIRRDFYKKTLYTDWDREGGKDNEHPTLLPTTPFYSIYSSSRGLRLHPAMLWCDSCVTWRWDDEWGNMLLHHHNFSLLHFDCRIKAWDTDNETLRIFFFILLLLLLSGSTSLPLLLHRLGYS